MAKIPRPIRDRFDLEALLYYEEKRAEAYEKEIQKNKDKRDHGFSEVQDFDSYQRLLQDMIDGTEEGGEE